MWRSQSDNKLISQIPAGGLDARSLFVGGTGFAAAVAVASVDVQKYTPGTALQACGDLPEIPIIGPIVPDGVPCFATVAEVGTGWYLLLLGVTIQWCCSLFVAFCAHATLPYELEPKLDRGVRGRRESLQFGWDREGPASVLRRDRSEY